MDAFQQTLSTTPAPVALAVGVGSAAAAKSANVKNIGAAILVYLGKSDVSTTTGYPLSPNESVSIDVYGTDTLYAVAVSGAPKIAVLRSQT